MKRYLTPMSTAQIKAAFTNELGMAGTCTAVTMQYVDDGKMQLLRFYVRKPGRPEMVHEAKVPRGDSLLAAAKIAAKEVREDA